MEDAPILDVRGLNKSFPGVHALKDFDLRLERGEVHAIVGENGAGKSTFLKILSGELHPDAGAIQFDGKEVAIRNTKAARTMGIGMVYQEVTLVPTLSVAENVFLGAPPKRGPLGAIDWATMYRQAEQRLGEYGVIADVQRQAREYGVGQQQLIETVRALSPELRLLMLDEPTSALSQEQIQILFDDVIRPMRKQGITVIYISHRLDEIFEIADNVTVMRDGEKIRTMPVNQTDEDTIIQLMVGREIEQRYVKEPAEQGEELLRVEHIRAEGLVSDVSLDARSGELVGVAGLMGAGRTEMAKCIAGLFHADGGRIYRNGREVSIKTPRDALENGIAYLAENRNESLVFQLNISPNITLADLSSVFSHGVLDAQRERQVGNRYIRELSIDAQGEWQRVLTLSGGNQQKVALARWLYSNVDVFILDEPTRGIDVGAKVEVYRLMNRILKDGKAIVMISSELPEIVQMSDRVFVLYKGRSVAEHRGADITQETIIRSATGREVEHAE
jgi:ribose transport system ATP-binding protein